VGSWGCALFAGVSPTRWSWPVTAVRPGAASIRSRRKPLNHFLPGSSVLSFGTVGRNLPAGSAQPRRAGVPGAQRRCPAGSTGRSATGARAACRCGRS